VQEPFFSAGMVFPREWDSFSTAMARTSTTKLTISSPYTFPKPFPKRETPFFDVMKTINPRDEDSDSFEQNPSLSVIDEVEEEGRALDMPNVPYRRVAFVEPAIKPKAQRQNRRLAFARRILECLTLKCRK